MAEEPEIVKIYNKLKTEKTINKSLLNNRERIIVTMTSWKKRIQYVAHVVRLMKKQTLKPDKIILNLSTDEFTGGEYELPDELLFELDSVFEIYWVKENTKVYKKVLPTLERFPNDIIVSIDDDIEYPSYFIEKIYIEFAKHSGQMPITAGTYKWENDIYSHFGCFSMFKKNMFGEYLNDLYQNVVLKYGIEKIPFADPVFTYAALLNNVKYGYTSGMNMSKVRNNSPLDKQNATSKRGTVDYLYTRNNEHKLLRKYIKEKYNKTYDELTKTPIIVNVTTWTQRDYCLPETLENFKNQTLQPDKIILWLSEKEYDENNLPESIKKCINEKLVSEVRFVKGNAYNHKRYECFKENNYCYNVFIDDDILYKPHFLKNLVKAAKEHPDCITCYCAKGVDYDDVKVEISPALTEESYTNSFLAGLSCFPPFTFPINEAYLYSSMRDKYVKKCDESWIRPLLIKRGIKTVCIKPWDKEEFPVIDGSQEVATWKSNKGKYENGMREKERNFFNAIKIFEVEQLAKQIWPRIGIDNWTLKTPEEMENL